MHNESLLGAGVDPCVDRLVTNHVLVGIGGSIHGGHCAIRLGLQAPAYLAWGESPEKISSYAVGRHLVAIQHSRLGTAPGRGSGLASLISPIRTAGPVGRAISQYSAEDYV